MYLRSMKTVPVATSTLGMVKNKRVCFIRARPLGERKSDCKKGKQATVFQCTCSYVVWLFGILFRFRLVRRAASPRRAAVFWNTKVPLWC